MAKYVKCIQGDLGVALTEGNCYKVIIDSNMGYLIENDNELFEYFRDSRFGEPYDLPEAITFTSQEDFEDAVMNVLKSRLEVFEWREGCKEYFHMEDNK